MRDSVRVSVPGSLMMLGEHAVLRGYRALACAIDKRMHVAVERVSAEGELTVEIDSQLGSYKSALAELLPDPRFRFIIEALEQNRELIDSSLKISVESGFSHQVGFGSSAAVTVGVLQCLSTLFGKPLSKKDLIKQATAVVRNVQGLGSGTDVAASVLGGLIVFRSEPLEFQKLENIYPIAVAYSGAKRATAEVVAIVNANASKQPTLFANVFEVMDQSVEYAAAEIAVGDWLAVGQILNLNQGLMEAIGVGTLQLSKLVSRFRECSGVYGAKISGSGLGDCVLALGEYTGTEEDLIAVAMDSHGIRFE